MPARGEDTEVSRVQPAFHDRCVSLVGHHEAGGHHEIASHCNFPCSFAGTIHNADYMKNEEKR
jgi:hypothetical protein